MPRFPADIVAYSHKVSVAVIAVPLELLEDLDQQQAPGGYCYAVLERHSALPSVPVADLVPS